MHILFLNPQGNFDRNDTGWTEHPDFGGQLVYVKEIAIAMAAQGHDVDIITRQVLNDERWTQFADRFDQYAGQSRVRVIRIPCGPERFLNKEELWPCLNEWVEGIISFYEEEGRKPDAATGHYGDGGLAAALLKDRTGIPFTFTGHSLGAQKLDKFLKEEPDLPKLLERFHFDKRIAAERVSMAHASRIVVSTSQEQMEQYSHQAYQGAVDTTDNQKFAVIPPGVNLKVFGLRERNELEDTTAAKIEQMLTRDIPAERRNLPVVICSSRLERKKNHLALVQAWAESPELRASANLVIVLRGSSDPLRDRASIFSGTALDILNDVVDVIEGGDLWDCISAFDLNSQAELAAAYRHLARERQGIFCLTALYEPFGLAPLEAMAAGLPAVVTRNGGPSESMRDNDREYGILIDPADPVDIARGLCRLTTDTKGWQEFQEAGIYRVDSQYTWQRTAESYLREIEAVLDGNDLSMSSAYPLPAYFRDTEKDDIDQRWLQNICKL